MSVAVNDGALVVSGRQTVSLGQLFQVTGSASDPAYLVLNGFDRNEYTSAASGLTGSLSGGGSSLGFNPSSGDAREAGVVFQYQASTGRYYSSLLGYLDQLTYTSSASSGDITDFSLFGTSNLRQATSYASNLLDLAQVDAAGYLGTLTVATEPGFLGPIPTQATPDSIAAGADGFIGHSWNMDGCWTLASTIAAEAGASLPVQSTADMAGAASGEWFVAFNGPAGSSGNWQSMVRAGDMIGFVTASGSGHITTCVAGAGGSAMLVDNETLVDWTGGIVNAAGDGSAADITIQAPHAASQEWAGVSASSVVIYRLDTPVVTASTGTLSLPTGAAENLAALFSAADPAGRTVADYQVFNTDPNDTLVANGAVVAVKATTTVSALSQVSLDVGNVGGADTLSVRAFNGSFWGDWTSLTVQSAEGAAPISTATVSATQQGPEASITPGTIAVYRFFETTDGTHFFTASTAERDSLLATRPDMTYEGIGLNAVDPASADAAATPVFRFFDATDGTHFFTASVTERDSLLATRQDMSFEGIAFDEDATQQQGDSPVYRFFDSQHGTHLFTEDAAERATILATRPDLTPEGIAFYAPRIG